MTSKLKTEWGEEGHGKELGSDREKPLSHSVILHHGSWGSVQFLGANEITSLPLRLNGWRDIAGNKRDI